MSTSCPFCGAYSTRSCESPDEDLCLWEEAHRPVCQTCGDSGVIVKRVTVYEIGCGFPHDDEIERPCPECRGPDPDLLRDDRNERIQLAKEDDLRSSRKQGE